MNPQDFQLAREIFEELCDMPADQHAAALGSRLADRPEVRALVVSLLAEDQGGGQDLPRADGDGLGAQIPERIGPYRLLRVCGRGGMGLVYEAEQDNPRRRVAIKMIRAGLLSKEVQRRFRWETEILGRLQHPCIGQILEAGSVDFGEGPQPYFAMEFIEGLTLIEYAKQRRLSTAARLELITQVCEAVHYAHQRGVIHRDLKPDNIIVTAAGTSADSDSATRPVHGLPKILDFGIARVTDADRQQSTILTHAGQLVGTLQYMSPEQATGLGGSVDTRTDIYSIGVLLFELLSGRLPYDLAGASIGEALRQIEEVPPARLGAVDARLAGDVETIVAKCLEKQPEQRYASASELAEDIRRHLRHEPIAARPPSALYHVRKFVQRRRALVGGMVTTLLALIAGMVLSLNFAFRADASADRALRESYRAGIAAASAVILEDPAAARRFLEATPESLRGWEWYHLMSRLERHVLTYAAPDGASAALHPETPVRFDPAGELLFALVDMDDTTAVGVWNASEGTYLQALTFEGGATAFEVAGHESVALYVGTADGQVWRCGFDGSERTRVALEDGGVAPTTSVRQLVAGPSGVVAAATSESLWVHTRSGSRRVLDQATLDIALSPDGRELAAIPARSFRGVAFYDCESGRAKPEILSDQIRENPSRVTYSADGERLLVGTEHRLVVVFDGETRERTGSLVGHRKLIGDLDWHGATQSLATSSIDGTVRIWRGTESVAVLNTGEAIGSSAIAFTPDGAALAYTEDAQVRLWSLNAGRATVLREHTSYVYSVAYSPDGRWLASGARYAPESFLWDAAGRTLEVELEVAAFSMGFADDGRWIVNDQLHAAETGEHLGLAGADVPWQRLRSDYAHSASAGLRAVVETRQGETKHTVLVIRDGAGNVVFEIPGMIQSVAFDPPGQRLALGRMNGHLEIWDVSRWELLQSFPNRQGSLFCAEFHPDGTRLATGGNDGTIHLWDTGTWEVVHELRGHDSYVKSLAFSPDGTQLASGSGDFTVRVWDTVRAEERANQARSQRRAKPAPVVAPVPR